MPIERLAGWSFKIIGLASILQMSYYAIKQQETRQDVVYRELQNKRLYLAPGMARSKGLET